MIIDFLKTETTIENLKIALKVLREFKECEGDIEWLATPFVVWSKLDQLEEYLAHLVDGEDLL